MFPNISAEIARNGMTLSDLAKALNVNRKTISNWLNGRSEIPASSIVAMAHIFKCSTDYLLGIVSDQWAS